MSDRIDQRRHKFEYFKWPDDFDRKDFDAGCRFGSFGGRTFLA